MKIEACTHMKGWFLVSVNADELQCDVRKLPYPATIGVFEPVKGRIQHWTPAAYVPRGYVKAARESLFEAMDKHKQNKENV